MPQNKIAILGANGTLGERLRHYLIGAEIIPLTRADADVTDKDAVAALLRQIKPGWVINCTAFLNTDRCEQEPDASYKVNYLAAAQLGEIIVGMPDTRLIQFSTDYVFDGREGSYTEQSPANPLSAYGKHKFMADETLLSTPAYILRIASLVGAGEGRPDIIKSMLGRVAGGAKKLDVVQELEISTATTQFIVQAITQVIAQRPETGIYNTVAEGKTSWFDIVREAFATLKVEAELNPIPASAFPRPTPRPLKSWLKTDKLRNVLGSVPAWQDAVTAQVQDLREVYMKVLENRKAA